MDHYQHLLEIILAQKTALQRDNFDELDRLTDEKKKVIDQIIALQQGLSQDQFKDLTSKIKLIYQQIVKEDEIFNLLLKEKKILLGNEIENAKQSQINIEKIGNTYSRYDQGGANFSG